jgi:hypothetical protein
MTSDDHVVDHRPRQGRRSVTTRLAAESVLAVLAPFLEEHSSIYGDSDVRAAIGEMPQQQVRV